MKRHRSIFFPPRSRCLLCLERHPAGVRAVACPARLREHKRLLLAAPSVVAPQFRFVSPMEEKMSLAKLDYLCDAPKGLPSSLFPISLGSVRSDVHDLSLDYHADTKRLHVLITLAQGVNPGDANPGAPFDDLIIGIVDHASFELVFPIESPRLVAYNDPSGGVTIFAEPATVRIS